MARAIEYVRQVVTIDPLREEAHHELIRLLTEAGQAEDAQRQYIQSVAGSSSSAADEISKLASLRDAGTITEEEFQAQKAKILGT